LLLLRLSAGLRSMAEGGVPNNIPLESLSLLGGAMTPTSSPEAPPFGPRPIASRSDEGRTSLNRLLNSGQDIEAS